MVPEDILAPWEKEVQLEQAGQWVQRVSVVSRVLKDTQVLKVQEVLMVIQGRKVPKDKEEILELKAREGYRASKAQQANKALKGLKGLREAMDHTVKEHLHLFKT